MLFNSYEFVLIFLPTITTGYFTLNHFKKYSAAKLLLIIGSLYFYAYFNFSYLFIIISSILFNYLINKGFRYFKRKSIRVSLLICSLLGNLGILFYFKYFNFLLTNINLFLSNDIELFQIILPLGISFFTFQQLSYLIDSYRGEVPDYKLLDYSLFVTFFPQLVAGPIVLHSETVPQFEDINNKKFNFENFTKGLYAFSIGLTKKVIIADTFGKIVDFNYTTLSTLTSVEAILTILSYTAQIYFDFSGYCDMATGIGLMFNIKLPQNFNSPYKATDCIDFWKRWHITLTRFLTKYIYIPLGGNRKGTIRTFINIFIVFIISGIWHGAGYTFILWGALHGLAQIINKLLRNTKIRIPKALLWIINFIFLNITWTYFRAPSIQEAHLLFSRVFSGGTEISNELKNQLLQPFFIGIFCQVLPILAVIIIFVIIAYAIVLFAKNTNELLENFKPTAKTWLATYFMLIFSILSMSGVSSFLYFNF